MSMSRRDYAEIADEIAHEIGKAADAGDAGSVLTLTMLAKALAATFAQRNPRFDTVTFLTACGIEQ